MFDVGFSELVVIALVALIVIGPERLPKVARTAGILLGRLQRYVNDVKADINREMQLEELKKLQQQMANQVQDLGTSVTQEMRAVETALNEPAAAAQGIPAVAAPNPGQAAPLDNSLAAAKALEESAPAVNQPASGSGTHAGKA